MNMTTLYIVATPIGNLEDISNRALRILSEVDLILCEDTRTTRKLLERYKIATPTLAYHQHSKLSKIDYIIGLLEQGKNLALVSDAGTPGISDPGNKLIAEANKFITLSRGEGQQIAIVPIPGPSAITVIASICGFPMDRFVFLGFPPVKKKRQKFFEEVLDSKYPVIFYESPYRILKTLADLRGTLPPQSEGGMSPCDMSVVVGRELTKKFETICRGSIEQVIEQIKKDAPNGKPRGEFAVALNTKER